MHPDIQKAINKQPNGKLLKQHPKYQEAMAWAESTIGSPNELERVINDPKKRKGPKIPFKRLSPNSVDFSFYVSSDKVIFNIQLQVLARLFIATHYQPDWQTTHEMITRQHQQEEYHNRPQAQRRIERQQKTKSYREMIVGQAKAR